MRYMLYEMYWKNISKFDRIFCTYYKMDLEHSLGANKIAPKLLEHARDFVFQKYF